MRVLVTGSHGLVGSALLPYLAEQGHEGVALSRSPGAAFFWNPEEGVLSPDLFDGIDAVVHLAGASIAAHRWTSSFKQELVDSRIKSTALLAQTLCSLKTPPQTLICASAVGFYGNRGDETLNEESGKGRGFLSDLADAWEKAAQPATQAGVRLLTYRFGMILSEKGGALAKILPPFRHGAGGQLADGKQFMSWIELEDTVRALLFGLETNALQGPINIVSPHPVTNREFTQALAALLHKSAPLAVPAFAARMLFGEMADALLLSSVRALPAKLLEAGFQFRYPTIAEALRAALALSN